MRYMPEYEATAAYDDMLDEVYEDVQIAGYSYSTSNALKEVDPIAYHTGMSDWLDGEGITTDESEADEESDDEDEEHDDEDE